MGAIVVKGRNVTSRVRSRRWRWVALSTGMFAPTAAAGVVNVTGQPRSAKASAALTAGQKPVPSSNTRTSPLPQVVTLRSTSGGRSTGHGGFREVWHWRYSTGCDNDKVSFQIEQPNGGLMIIGLDVDFEPANLSFEVVHDRLQLHARPRTSARVDRQTQSPSQSAPNGRTDQRCAPDY
jgi:hypothetical protein